MLYDTSVSIRPLQSLSIHDGKKKLKVRKESFVPLKQIETQLISWRNEVFLFMRLYDLM